MEEFITLYDKGLNDAQIAKILGYKSPESARYHRLKLNLTPNHKLDCQYKIDRQSLIDLVNAGKNDIEIAELLKSNVHSIWQSRKRWNINRPSFNKSQSIPITQRQLELLTGCLLGDGSLTIEKGSITPRFSCSHGIKQKDYCFWKYQELESLGVNYKESIRKNSDSRTGIYYETATVRSIANTEYHSIYNTLYKNGRKVISKEFLENYTSLSLAIHFMDDGTKTNNSYSLATHCFSKNDLDIFREHLKDNFGLDFTTYKSGISYFPAKYRSLFNYHILPHIHPSMTYKIVS